MELGLRGKVAIVGGGSKGLGRACAIGLANEGTRVAICSRNAEALQQAAREISQETGSEVLPVAGDLSSYDDVKSLVAQTVEHFGSLDILVNNSGGPPAASAQDATEEQWEQAIQLSLMFFARMSREALPHMRRSGGGRIINIFASSVKQPIENLMLSAATRLGALGFAKTLADEVAKDGILVNNVAPGYLETARMMEVVESRAQSTGITHEQALAGLNKMIPMGRIGRPEELANLVVFLASDAASYITGTTIQVDGGVIRSML
ncbi:MAG: 3-oxoacyl-ACP reductase [SAR202 cluster bacterium Casp-Chloro-G4]|nr:SDR family oxidoreductase [Chloroflexota bacterium]PKB61647.1 MAG: 3-oxoacyl-ACP reductase [SAR202 cluster bacterium Casp-Chloro-G4]